MKKIPTIFERDWNGDRSRVLNQIHAGCEWVLAGEGVATRKLDGTCCMVRDRTLYKRREIKSGQPIPPDFENSGTDEETWKTVGWVPVGDGAEDRWHRDAWNAWNGKADGTYELIGPKVQDNPEHVTTSILVRHGEGIAGEVGPVPRDFDTLRAWLATQDIEGLVFHHPDGRMAKIKLRDFGLKRQPPSPPEQGRE